MSSSISGLYEVKLTASPTRFLSAKGVGIGKTSPSPNFQRLENLLATPVCQSCRRVITLLQISGAGDTPEGTSGLKTEVDLYECGTKMNENRMMGQSDGKVAEPYLLLQHADMLMNPSDRYPSQNYFSPLLL